VAVDDAALVAGGQTGTQLAGEGNRAIFGKAADTLEQRREILAVDVLHREGAAAVRLAEVVEAADVLVRHLSRDAQLVVELREAGARGRDPLRPKIEGDPLVAGPGVGAVRLCPPPPAAPRGGG